MKRVIATDDQSARVARKLMTDLKAVEADLDDLYAMDEELYDELDLSSLHDEVAAARRFIASR